MNEPRTSLKRWFPGGSLIWPLIGLAILLIFNLIYTPTLFRLQILNGHLYGSLVDILNQGSRVMLLSIGMTLVIACGGVDLSVGSVMAISGAIAAMLVTTSKLPFGAVIICALAVSTVAGLCNGYLVARAGIQPIIATLILMVAGRGVAMLITHGQIITFEHAGFVFFGNGHFLGFPFTVTVVALVFALTALATRKTAIGLFLESVGDNETAARFCGINSAFVKWVVYGFSGFCAGIAGLLATSNIKAADSSRVGEMMELDAIFAVVVGGTALTGGRLSLLGSIVGALLIQTLTTTLYNLGVPPAVAPVPKAILVVCVCLLQSPKFRAEILSLFPRKRRPA